MKIWFEHIYSFTKAKTIEQHLDLYQKAGFTIADNTVRHPPGVRNGFVYIGAEYLEFLWIENKRKYNNEKDNYHDEFLKHPGPFGLALEVKDIEKFHQRLDKKVTNIPDLYARGPAGAKNNDKPWWTFQHFLRRTLPGALPFALRYETRDYSHPRLSRVCKNGIFAISGLSFVSYDPIRDASRWSSILNLGELDRKNGPVSLALGPHLLTWSTKKQFLNAYGADAYLPHNKKFSHLRKIALVHLYSEDVAKSKRFLDKAGWRTKYIHEKLYVYPNRLDGYAFLIAEYTLKQWLSERKKLGQKLKTIVGKFK